MNKTVIATFTASEAAFSRWMDSVEQVAISFLSRFSSPRTVQLIDDGNGEFVLQANEGVVGPNLTNNHIRIDDGNIDHITSAMLTPILSGSRVELTLQSDRFLFRPLELPNRATEFMDGIVRSQIDRLTPWNTDGAAFGWSEPVELDDERMVVIVAATALNLVKPYVRAIAKAGAQSIAVFTTPPEGGTPIKVWDEQGLGMKDQGRIRQTLVKIFAATAITAGVALGVNLIVGTALTAQQDELVRQISKARAAVGVAPTTAFRSNAMAQRALEHRKQDTAAAVLVLETLSKILPDDTYVTELRIDGNKLRVSGVSRNAPSLIRLIEQSGRFSRATFFAPTTRSSSDRGDQFHIEAIIQPLGTPS